MTSWDGIQSFTDAGGMSFDKSLASRANASRGEDLCHISNIGTCGVQDAT
jgi:hypothetical protein